MSGTEDAFFKAVDDVIYSINDAFRKEEKYVVLQNYDIMTASPDVYRLAEESVAHREELAVLDARDQQFNVISPRYLDLRAAQFVKQKKPDSEEREVSTLAKQIYDTEFRLEVAWGQCVLSTMNISPEEEEHIQSMVETFESIFQRHSDYLRTLVQPSDNATDAMRTFQLQEGHLGTDVILAALSKHPPLNTTELGVIMEFFKMDDVVVTTKAAEFLEKLYVKFMKQEGAENVFHSMVSAGLPPMSNRPFAMLFNLKKVERVASILDYYELMLDYSISPEVSVLRVLCKQCSGIEFASLHFTLVQHNPLLQEQPSAPPSGTSNNPDSWRQNERAYFAFRLQEAVEADPKFPLLEAMKCIHRAEVERTSLEGDTLILTFLLTRCCNGTTPLRDLVFPFSRSLAYQPGKVQVYTEEELIQQEAEQPAKVFEEVNAFNFGLDSNKGELLEDPDEEGLGELEEGSEDQSLEPVPQEERKTRGHHKSSRIAASYEEAEYVLRVLADYNSFPDNKALETISHRLNHKPHGISMIEHVIMGVLSSAQQEQSPEALRIHLCTNYIQYLVRRNYRQKAMTFLKAVLEQFYEFVHIRKVSWSSGTHSDNEKHIMNLFVIMMKSHQLPWSLGLFTIALCMGSTKIDAAKPRLMQLLEKEYRGPAYNTVTRLDQCDWDKTRILTCPELVPCEPEKEDEEIDSIFTTPAQAASSYTNQQALDSHSLYDYMYFALRDIHVERSVLDFFKCLLKREQEIARQTLKDEVS